MIKLFTLIIVIIFTACSSQRASYVPQKEKNSYSSFPVQENYYLVKKGDSLWGISKKYGVNVQTLMRENNIFSPQDLKEGQMIKLRVSSTAYSDNPDEKTGSNYFSWPVKGEIINFFGEQSGNVLNKGINIKVNGNDYVKASGDGEVVYYNHLNGWGPTLILKHPDNFYTIYANVIANDFNDGKHIKRGEVVGEVASGKDGSRILHFEIRKQHLARDPVQYFR